MIGYYVHHHGRGHLQRSQCLAAALSEPVTILSSTPRPRGAAGSWIDLPRDDDSALRGDPTAGGVLHWAPLHDVGLRRRMALIAGWIADNAPSVMVVDVSVEVTALCRLMGVPVVAVAMPGDRSDPPHRLGYDLADALLACWPAEVMPPSWPTIWTDKAWFVGAFSRFDRRIGESRAAASTAHRRRAVVLLGTGGSDLTAADLAETIAAVPEWDWDVLGGRRWRADPWPALRAADVVVTHAGQNALAEVAAARVPAVVIPQRRPHEEQFTTAGALERADLAVVLRHWPAPTVWRAVLDEAATMDGRHWARWCPGNGAGRAAAHIDDLAATSPRGSVACGRP